MRKTRLMAVMATAGIFAGISVSFAAMDKDTYKAAMQRIDDTYKAEANQCKSLSGNTKDVCVVQAKAKQKIDKAEAEAEYKATGKARTAARIARADGEYSVAKEKCDDLAGNVKDVCLKKAKAAHVSATADAKSDRKVNDARNDAAKTANTARRDAAEDKRDAEYKVAIERCDAFSGDAKSRCVSDAKTRFGKS